MRRTLGFHRLSLLAVVLLGSAVTAAAADEESFSAMMERMKKGKPQFAKRQSDLLTERYDLADRPAAGVTMSRGKPVQEGVRAKLPKDTTWDKLASMTPDEIKQKNLWPAGFYPL